MSAPKPNLHCFQPVFHTVHGGTKKSQKHSPIVFLHGFLGCKKNFKHMQYHYKRYHKRDTYTVDARNHGDSQKRPSFAYEDQSIDLEKFMKAARIDKATFVGYSMGAKTAMHYALKHPEKVDKLICIDNAPVTKPLGPQFVGYVDALKETYKWAHQNYRDYTNHLTLIRDVTAVMTKNVGGSQSLALYLMNNIKFKDFYPRCRMPLQFINERTFEELGEFPPHEKEDAVDIPALFIKAGKSDFIDDEGVKAINTLFPNSRVETFIDAKHENIMVRNAADVLGAIDRFLGELEKDEVK